MKILPARSKGRHRTQQPEIRTTVISSDYHIPYHDIAAYNAFKHFLTYLRPDYHIINGDFIDAGKLSTFLQDPADVPSEIELETANLVLDELFEVSPNTITKLITGNHEKRLTKRLWETPELMPFVTKGKSPLQVLADCLSLDERQIDYFDYPDVYNHFGVYITHGEAANIHASKKESEVHNVSGISGHVHSNKYWERRGRNGVVQWWSIGGLCSRNVSYRPNNGWVQGFAVLYQIVGTDIFTVLPVTIVKGQFIYDGKLFHQDGVMESK